MNADHKELSDITESLRPMFERAEKEHLWFHCGYQDLWFSPKQLRDSQREGRFRWGAVNWELRDPMDHYNELVTRARATLKEAEDFKARI